MAYHFGLNNDAIPVEPGADDRREFHPLDGDSLKLPDGCEAKTGGFSMVGRKRPGQEWEYEIRWWDGRVVQGGPE